MSSATSSDSAWDRRRWLILGVIALAQLMVVLDLTVMNIALPSAQRALHFTTVDRQWVVTAYSLAFGSLLLLGGRLADLLGRKVTFLAGLVGFAGVSAIGGASVNFTMLIIARACQGAFAALLVPSALSLLTTTFTGPKGRGRAFGIYGAIAGAGGAVGLLLGGVLTQYLSWRWCLYVNLIFAGVSLLGGALLLERQPSPTRPRLDIPGVLLVSGALFCLVYGFSNAASHSWHAPSTYGFLAAGVALGALFALWQGRAAHPLLLPRVVLDRNRGGAYLSMLFASAGLFGTFLFLTYYQQQTLGYSPFVTGVAFLPLSAGLILASYLSTIALMPRVGPRPLVASGLLAAAGGAAWLAQLGPHTGYGAGVLGPMILAGVGIGMVIAPAIIATRAGWLCDHWDQPDEGIWETRGGPRKFLYSQLMCWVAMERAIRLALRRGLPADLERWRAARDTIYRRIMDHGWSPTLKAFAQYEGGDVLDAAVLLMPLVKFISPTDPKWLSTLDALTASLVSDSLVYRYDPQASPDGVRGDEGTFSACSFWYVEALTRAGRLEAARLAFEKMLTYANHLGLYAEQISRTGEQQGNFPQALTHLTLISAAFNLNRALG